MADIVPWPFRGSYVHTPQIFLISRSTFRIGYVIVFGAFPFFWLCFRELSSVSDSLLHPQRAGFRFLSQKSFLISSSPFGNWRRICCFESGSIVQSDGIRRRECMWLMNFIQNLFEPDGYHGTESAFCYDLQAVRANLLL